MSSSTMTNDAKGLAPGGQSNSRVTFAATNVVNGIIEKPPSTSAVLSTSLAASKAHNAAMLGEASALVQRQRARGESVLVSGMETSSASNMRRHDHLYTHELARRSVALVATHLGVGDCTSETLDVLGDALIDFISKFGEIMANTAEISNRPSSHCNIYDALHAAETLLSQPAAQQMTVALVRTEDDAAEGVLATAAIAGGSALHVASTDATIKPHDATTHKSDDKQQSKGGGSTTDPSDKMDTQRLIQSMCKQNGWESIAEFAFGPNWFELGRRVMSEDDHTVNKLSSSEKLTSPRSNMSSETKTNSSSSILKGKNPEDKLKTSSDGTNNEGMGNENVLGHADGDETQIFLNGWNAPYPDLVASYPIRKKIKMNFTPVSLIEEACFDQPNLTTVKDSLKRSSSTKHVTGPEKDGDDAAGKKAKRQSSKRKLSDNTPKKATDPANETISQSGDYRSLSFAHPFEGPIPPWCPPFPPSFTYQQLERKPVVSHQDVNAATLTSASSNKVNTATDYKEVRKNLVAMQKVEEEHHDVSHRRTDDASGSNYTGVVPLASDPSSKNKEPSSSVAPLARPSANRANRILEGSMDSSQL